MHVTKGDPCKCKAWVLGDTDVSLTVTGGPCWRRMLMGVGERPCLCGDQGSMRALDLPLFFAVKLSLVQKKNSL